MANQTGDITSFNQQFNPLTGDIQFNPASWGLTMKDIEAASQNVKTAIYSGNINLTADFYQEIKDLSDTKYQAIDTNGSVNTTTVVDTSMTGKDSGLYMNNQRMGFWNGTEWKMFMANTGDFAFDGDIGNYIRWNGTTLTIQGDILLPGGETVAEAIAAIPDPTWANLQTKPSVLELAAVDNPTPAGSGLFISNTHLGYYASGAWKTYMQSNGNFGLAGTLPSNYLTWDGTNLKVRGDIEASTITASLALVGNVVRGGKTTYADDTTSGYWIGLDATVPKFNIGDATSYVKWNGTTLVVRGDIQATSGTFSGNITSSAIITGGTINGANINSVSNDTYTTTNINGGLISTFDAFKKIRTTISGTGFDIKSTHYTDGVNYSSLLKTVDIYDSGDAAVSKLSLEFYDKLNLSGYINPSGPNLIVSSGDNGHLYLGGIGGGRILPQSANKSLGSSSNYFGVVSLRRINYYGTLTVTTPTNTTTPAGWTEISHNGVTKWTPYYT